VKPTRGTKGIARKEIPISVDFLKREAGSGHARLCASRIALFCWNGMVFESLWMKTIGQMTIELNRNDDTQLNVVGISPQESEILTIVDQKGKWHGWHR
jgi:hypothetical protein